MAERVHEFESPRQPQRGLYRLGEGILEVVGTALEEAPLEEGERSQASQNAFDKNNEQYIGALRETLAMVSAQLDDPHLSDSERAKLKEEHLQLQHEIRAVYMPNATMLAEKDDGHFPE